MDDDVTKWTMPEGRYVDVIPRLLEPSLGYNSSPEFRLLAGTGDDIPGIVASSYGAYVARRLKENASESELRHMMTPLGDMLSWDDAVVTTMIRDEIFERLETEEADERLERYMSEAVAQLLVRWRLESHP